jgi:hypothetical protein
MNMPAPEPAPQSPESSGIPRADLLKDHALLLNETSTLSDLVVPRAFDQEQVSFLFPILPYSRPVFIPESLGIKVSDVDYVQVTVGDAELPNELNKSGTPSFLSIDIIAGNKTILLSRSGTNEGKGQPDWAYTPLDGEEYDALTEESSSHGLSDLDTSTLLGIASQTKLKNGEINKLIMSLASLELLDEKDEAYDSKNLLSSELYETLRDALREKALQTTELRGYMLSDGETEVIFTRCDDQLESFTINYFDMKRQEAVSVQCELQPFDLKFYTFGYSETIGHKLQLIPTTGDISDVRRLIRDEIELIKPGTLSGENDKQKPTSELDQYGFNPPNPSAA